MASDVDICNLALARLGDQANLSSLLEESTQADHCRRFYPIARDTLMSAHPWHFATKRSSLPKLVESPGGGLSYFSLPPDCTMLIGVQNLAPEFYRLEYSVENFNGAKVVVARADRLVARYVSNQVSTQLFPADFVDALAWLLASFLAGAMIPGTSGAKLGTELYRFYSNSLLLAMKNDASHSREYSKGRDKYAGDANAIGGVYGTN